MPQSGTEMVHPFRDGLIKRVSLDLHFVADLFDVHVTDPAECHDFRLHLRHLFANTLRYRLSFSPRLRVGGSTGFPQNPQFWRANYR